MFCNTCRLLSTQDFRTKRKIGFSGGAWLVDLAPITDPDLVPVAVIRALGLPDQPRRPTIDTLLRFVGDRRMREHPADRLME